MISNERSSPYVSRPPFQTRPPVQEEVLKTALVQIERKTIEFTLKENARGRFLRISETAGEQRNAVIIPSTGLADFQKLVDEMIKASNELPPATPPAK